MPLQKSRQEGVAWPNALLCTWSLLPKRDGKIAGLVQNPPNRLAPARHAPGLAAGKDEFWDEREAIWSNDIDGWRDPEGNPIEIEVNGEPSLKTLWKKNLDASDSFQQNSSWSKCQAAKPRCRIHQVAAPCKLWSKTVQHVFQEISTFKFHHASRVCRVRVCILSYIYIYFNYLQMYVWIHMHARIAFRKSTFGRAYHFAMVSSTQFWTSSLLTSGLVVSAYPLNQCELGWGIPNAKQMDCSSEVKDWNWIL